MKLIYTMEIVNVDFSFNRSDLVSRLHFTTQKATNAF
jgi:hypothetical protein